MNKSFLLLVTLFLINTKITAQDFSLNNFAIPDLKNYYIYYDFYNGIQMIEIDNLRWANDRAQYLDAIQPMNTTHAWGIPAIPNAYIFRNEKGEIIKQFNTLDNKYKSTDFISVDKLQGKTKSHKLNKLQSKPTRNSSFYYKFNKPDFGNFVFEVFGSTHNIGIIDTLGNLVSDTIYQEINYAKGNYYFKLNGKWGLMNDEFKTIIQPKYKALSYFRKNTHCAKTNSGCGIINSNENVLVDFIYKEIVAANSFYFFAVDSVPDTLMYANGSPYTFKVKKYGIMDLNFKITTAPTYYEFTTFNEKHYWASKSTGHGMIDESGKEITPFKYIREPIDVNYGHYLISINLNDQKYGEREYRGFLDSNFKEVGEIKYDNVGFFIEGFGSVCINGKWGFIDDNGKQVVDCKYDHVNPMQNGFSIIHSELSDEETTDGRHDRYGVVDKGGNVVIPITYHGVDVDKNGTYIMCMYYKETLPDGKIEWKKNCDYYEPKDGVMRKIIKGQK